jgi:hypothetical protein
LPGPARPSTTPDSRIPTSTSTRPPDREPRASRAAK